MEPQTQTIDETKLGAYAQWASFTLQPMGFTLSVKNAKLQWGKFYANGNKDQEISAADVDKITVNSGDSATIYTCGRSDAASGTQGSFDLYNGEVKIGTYSWDCPWGSKTNTSTWTPDSTSYITQQTGGSLDGGALGSITIKVAKF